ncbi:MAG: sensor histidine kinase KdpD [Planctomycetes bacterium]|nr:sensor histidine kinase KdpD [Planctomycetota bacterium]
MSDTRPSPEELLARIAREKAQATRGRLKLFFGMAPGVGKTYAMLEEARTRAARGTDVLVGVVLTHGRAETEHLAQGLVQLPPKRVEHRGIVLEEFDLDAALARKPGLLLLDELAHTNAPGLRHAKRWQDVEELLDAGIEVYTTLNVQHVESLNDVVERLTGVRVRETVPDSILERADAIELVDLPPDELLARLTEGKVYVPAQAERALQSFFRKENLIALRELALRKTAERVDQQATEYRRAQGRRPGAGARERILIVLQPGARALDVLRAGRRLAVELRAPWIALVPESERIERLSDEARGEVSELLELARQLGGESLVVGSERAAEQILHVARDRGVTRVVVGRSRRRGPLAALFASLADELVRRAEDLEVLVTPGIQDDLAQKLAPRTPLATPLREYPLALVPVALAVLVGMATRESLNIADHAMINLLALLISASIAGRGPAFVATLASVASFDFFFIPPYYTFAVSDLHHVLTFAVMLVVGFIASQRTVVIREQAAASQERERRTAALYAMTRAFAVEDDPSAIAQSSVERVRDLLLAEACLFLPEPGGGLRATASTEGWQAEDEREVAVARWVFENDKRAGFGTDTLPAARALYLPMSVPRGTIAVMGVMLGALGRELRPSDHQMLDTFVAQAALALERVRLRAEADEARRAVETERLRTDLLSSVSHDLRTPLASIAGSAGVLLAGGAGIGRIEQNELLETIQSESQRLSELVSNLLDLTRLDSGALQPRREWCPVEELVHGALDRLHERLAGRKLELELPREILQAHVDPVLIEQALVHLVENALKYSPSGSPIELRSSGGPGEVLIEVSDRGPGIPPGEEQRIFEKFVRLPDGKRAGGSGLGLSVCRAILRAHGGSVVAENRLGGGATFRMRLPVTKVPPPPARRQEDAP